MHPNRTELDEVLRASPLLQSMGIELADWNVGRAVTRITPTSSQGNIAGTVHGGVLYCLADAAFEAACNGAGRVSVALEISCHFVGAARIDQTLAATAIEVHQTRRTASYRIEVRSESDDALCAWFMALAFRTSRWHLGEQAWPVDWRERY